MIPLSFAQQRLWFLARLEGISGTYNMTMPLRLSGALDHDALQAALCDVVLRHESLRTLVAEVDGEPVQRIVDASELAMDFRVLPVAGEEELAGLLTAEGGRGFDLSADLPLRARLFAVSDTEHVLLLVIHHIACDGWSLDPLVRDVSLAYAARCSWTEPDWEPLPVQYADYALWQRELLGQEDDPDSLASQQLTYWRAQLSGVPAVLPLPLDRPRPDVPSHRGGAVPLRLDEHTHRQVTELARACGVSVFMVVQAAFAALLNRVGAGTDIPVGVPVAGRTDEGLTDLVGFFVNTLVLRNDLTGNPTFRELLTRTRDTSLAALDHQDLPFDRLVEALNPTRSTAHHPLFQVMLAFQSSPVTRFPLPGLDVSVHPTPNGTAKFDLCLTLDEQLTDDGTPAGLTGELEYATDLFDHTTAQALTERFRRLITAVLTDPGRRLSQLEDLSPEERRRITEEWSTSGEAVAAWGRHHRTPTGVPAGPDRLYVLDEGLRPVPVGVAGEVYVTGVDLGPSVACPFGGDRMFRTGDLARWRADGRLQPLGRAAGRVTVGGFRIDPDEVEAGLRRHPALDAVAVAVREEASGQRDLVAFAVTVDGAALDPSAVLGFAREALPEFMVPAAVVALDRMPVTADGEPDRAALAALSVGSGRQPALPLPADGPRGGGEAAPEAQAERTATLCEIFAEVLGMDEVEDWEDFFDLGGHSLLGMRLLSRVREQVGVELSLQTLFKAPTPAALAEHLQRTADDDPLRPLIPLRATGNKLPLFCVHPGAGIGWAYSGLLRHIAPDRPLHALQAHGLDGVRQPAATVEAMAAAYIDHLRAVQPHGPYHLLGWSFGGVVAQEMAIRLREAGEEVATLALLDAYPVGPDDEPERVEIGEQEVLRTILDFFGQDAPEADGPLSTQRVGEILAAQGTGFPGLTEGRVQAIATVQTNNVNLLNAHRPGRFDGDVVFFTAAEDDIGTVDEWRPHVTGRLHNHDVPCLHKDMMRPEPLEVIGQTMAAWLAEQP
ncbi:condensation domain-containing protein [Streptomyces sp. NPDC056411]|uniref:condensation domain-containing protein n=1 Tax=Streptomyces sp. NPDC056411 TaxID=3345813 RepID=UPI0035D5F221